MSDRKIWEVDFDVVGPITISEDVRFRQEKGFDNHQFYSDIQIKKSSYGFKATITAYAEVSAIAETVAYVYFGRMIDILSLDNDIPIQLNIKEMNYSRNHIARRVVNKSDIISAFNIARRLELEQPKLLRSIGWYAKGKLSSNPFDKFLSFWNVIEIVGKEYHIHTNRTTEGVKNKIYQCFIDYFGDIETWNLPENWIDDMYEKRSQIFHGGEDTTIESISIVSDMIPLMEDTSRKLINKIIDANYNRREFIHFDW